MNWIELFGDETHNDPAEPILANEMEMEDIPDNHTPEESRRSERMKEQPAYLKIDR